MENKIFLQDSRKCEGVFHVYCQIPFCRYQCPYCCYSSVFDPKDLTDLKLIPGYVKSLVHEIEYYDFPDKKMQSVNLGGGTPTLLSGSQAGKIIGAILKKAGHLKSDSFCVSFEASPEQSTRDKMEDFREAGFNRISIGIQSFIDDDLKLMGRRYGSQEAFLAIENSRSAGYEAISIDLLCGFPGSTFDNWIYNLDTAFDLDTECICINMMVYDYNGAPQYIQKMAKLGYAVPTIDDMVRMYDYALYNLQTHGYEKVSYDLFCKKGSIYRYEVSSVDQTDKTVCAFGPWAISNLDTGFHQGLPFIREYISQPLFKTISCSYKENVNEVLRGKLLCHGAVYRDDVEPLLGCSIEEAVSCSPKATCLVNDLLNNGYASLDSTGLIFKKKYLSPALIMLWTTIGR
ncbi:MAG: radical SAM protein [Desulfobacteraceae bacterium]|nr:radical SAM protein [Desulfobacteraceae bacterium]